MDYEKAYKDALSRAKDCHVNKKFSELDDNAQQLCEYIFPELAENEDERIRNYLLDLFSLPATREYMNIKHIGKIPDFDSIYAWLEKQGKKSIPEDINEAALQYVDTCAVDGRITHDNIIEPYWNNHSMMNAYKAGWLEKQGETFTKKDVDDAYLKGICDAKRELEKQGGDTNETINRDKFAQGVLKCAAINLITWIDYNASEGNMCLSNMECEDIEDALVSGNWDKIYAYIKKKLEKQGEQKPVGWNEEDEKYINDILAILSGGRGYRSNRQIEDWLKSLKPQPHWKPTQKQMDELEKLIVWADELYDENSIRTIDSLYNDLKKL